jgi:hypothetical protein
MKNGVPFHTALSMSKERADAWRIDEIERRAFSINFSIFEGGKFNWNTMRFEESR